MTSAATRIRGLPDVWWCMRTTSTDYFTSVPGPANENVVERCTAAAAFRDDERPSHLHRPKRIRVDAPEPHENGRVELVMLSHVIDVGSRDQLVGLGDVQREYTRVKLGTAYRAAREQSAAHLQRRRSVCRVLFDARQRQPDLLFHTVAKSDLLHEQSQ